MNQEFKKIAKGDTTRYILESASSGGTSAGSVASVSKPVGAVQHRDNLLVQDANPTPRSPVAHAAQKVAKGSGRHTDRKQQSKQVRGEKHKTKDFAENMDHEISMAGSELHSIFQDAKQLHAMIKAKSEEEGLDAWQQSKITKAADYLNSVLQSLQHKMIGEGERTMSRAAKGMMKYGKDGMKALAKAGREGASEKQLDTIRDKHDHYNEGWSQKYKNSINCSHPKGFSQRAHCAGKRKHNESIEMEMTCPDCGMCKTHGNLNEIKKGQKDSNGFTKCWPGYHAQGTKKSATTGKQVRNCVPNEGVAESQLAELDRPSGKLFIIVKADNAGATHVFGDFGSFPQDVMHKISKRGTRDKSGAKTKLKIDFLFDDFRSTIQQLRTIFRDVDFVGAEAAEFIIHSSALRSDQGEDVKHLRDYIEAGDDRRMKMHQKPEDDEDDDGETTGGNMLRIDPETGAARKVVGVKPQTQMGGKSTEQPTTFKYTLLKTELMPKLRDMGFKFDGNQIILRADQRDKLMNMLGSQFQSVFGQKGTFKEENMGLSEKAVSQQQQKFFGMVHAMQKGEKIPGASTELKKTARDMSKGDVKDFAKTKHTGLPKKISEFKGSLPPDGLTPDEAKKFAADQQARLQALYKQPSQTTGADRDLGNGFTLTTTKFNGQDVPAIFDTQDKLHWIEKPEGTGRRYGMAPYLKIQNGEIEGKSPGDQTLAAMKAAGWAIPERAPARPISKPADQMSDDELEAELARRKGSLRPKLAPAPANEDTYTESLSAALNRKLGVKK
jgi:hypothetical protein